MTNVLLDIQRHKCGISNTFRFIVFISHMMSLNIDMKILRPLNCDGSPILVMNSWTLLMSCNVVNPVKYSTRIPSGLRQLCSRLYSGELLNHVNLFSQTVFDGGF